MNVTKLIIPPGLSLQENQCHISDELSGEGEQKDRLLVVVLCT
jgi:hypothetical protein